MAGTKAQRIAPPGATVDGATSYSPNGVEVVEHGPVPSFDKFSVLPEERKAFGVEDHETLAWIRNPTHWEKIEHSDRLREFSHERPGARQVFRDEMDPVTNGDLLLVAYPTALKEQEESRRTVEYREYTTGEDPDAKPRDRDRLKSLSERMTTQHQRDGLTGPSSPTQGLSYEQAVSKYSSAQIDAEEARYRGGTRQQSFSSDDWAKMVDRGRSGDRRDANRGKSIATGDTGIGKTTAQRLAARQQPK